MNALRSLVFVSLAAVGTVGLAIFWNGLDRPVDARGLSREGVGGGQDAATLESVTSALAGERRVEAPEPPERPLHLADAPAPSEIEASLASPHSPPPGGFFEHPKFASAVEYLESSQLNPLGVHLDDAAIEQLSRLITDASSRLASAQEECSRKAEEWARLRIANGDFRFVDSTQPLSGEEGSIQVIVSEGGLHKAATIFPGEYSPLDALSVDVATLVIATQLPGHPHAPQADAL